jgi:CheY-like chemotaxis protein
MDTLAQGRETVLLVDADPETRKLAAFMLGKRGYIVVEARSTIEALRLCESGGVQADLLLTELLMPQMSGSNLAARLRSLQPQLRVLFMSNAPDRVVRGHEVDRARGFLRKPFTMNLLAGKVREVLDAPQMRTAKSFV